MRQMVTDLDREGGADAPAVAQAMAEALTSLPRAAFHGAMLRADG